MDLTYFPLNSFVSSQATDSFNSDISTEDTINKMVWLARGNANSPILKQFAGQILHGLGYTDSKNRKIPRDEDIAKAVFWKIKHTVRFAEDEKIMTQMMGIDLEDGKELLIAPAVLLGMRNPTGDCDDFSTLAASVLLTLGFTDVYFCTIAADLEMPNKFSHVYVKVWLPNSQKSFTLDCSHGKYPNWETDKIYRSKLWKV